MTSVFVLLLGVIRSCTITETAAQDTLRGWNVSAAELTTGNAMMFAKYLEEYDNDKIYTFGGWNSPSYIYEYSISSDSISIYDTLPVFTYTYSVNCFHINDTLFWLDYNNETFHSYKLPTKEHTLLADYSGDINHSCIVRDPRDEYKNIAYVVAGSTKKFYYIDLNVNYSLVKIDSDSVWDRYIVNCISLLSSNDKPYMYQTGDSKPWERINLNDIASGWEKSPHNLGPWPCVGGVSNGLIFTLNGSKHGLVHYDGYLYSIASEEGVEIGVIDILNNNGSCSSTYFTPSQGNQATGIQVEWYMICTN